MNPRYLTLSFLLAALSSVRSLIGADSATPAELRDNLPRERVDNRLEVVQADPRLHFEMHPSTAVMAGDGRQPFLFCSASGALLCQAQINAKPYGTKQKKIYWCRLGSALSRDGGQSWSRYVQRPNQDEVNLEGGAVQCADGTILILDTYVMAGKTPYHGVGELWKSHDDLRTLEGPFFVDFNLPHINFASGSTDDDHRPRNWARLHRSIIELPNGDLLTSMYTLFEGDVAPSGYLATQFKTRVVIVRSRDHGASWSYLSTVGVDSGVGTEGFGEPAIVRVSHGPHAGRILCVIRTGRDFYASNSEDDGATWADPRPLRFPRVNIHDTSHWSGLFNKPMIRDGVPDDAMNGMLADPDLTEMTSGVLVCGFGARMPAKAYKDNWHAKENGDYLAFSLDAGDSWSALIRFRSGAPTTHYIGVRQSAPNRLFVVCDDSVWHMPGETLGFALDVVRTDPSP